MLSKLLRHRIDVGPKDKKICVSRRSVIQTLGVVLSGMALTLFPTGEGIAQADQALPNFTPAQEAALTSLLLEINVNRSDLGKKSKDGVTSFIGIGTAIGPAVLQARNAFKSAHPGVDISQAKMSHARTSDGSFIIIYTYKDTSIAKVTVSPAVERKKAEENLYQKAKEAGLSEDNSNLVFGFGEGALGPAMNDAKRQASIESGNTKRGQYIVRLESTGGFVVLVVGEKKRGVIDADNKFIAENGVQPGLAELVKNVDGKRWVGKLEGNGGRDVAIYIPPGADRNKPFEIIYHFHGTHGEIITSKKGGKKESTGANRLRQVLESAEGLNNKPDRNVIVVYPISAGRRGREGGIAYRNRYDDNWMLKGNSTNDDPENMHAEVLQTIQSQLGIDTNVGSITAKGHSAGGKALLNMVRSGFLPDRIDSLDGDYGWMLECYNKARKLAHKFKKTFEMNLFVEKGNWNYKKWSKRLQHKKGVQFIPSNTPHKNMNETFFAWERPKED